MHEMHRNFNEKLPATARVATPGTVNIAHLDDAFSELLNWKQVQ